MVPRLFIPLLQNIEQPPGDRGFLLATNAAVKLHIGENQQRLRQLLLGEVVLYRCVQNQLECGLYIGVGHLSVGEGDLQLVSQGFAGVQIHELGTL